MSDDRMQPLARLPAARLRGVRGILSDIDDTLTRDGAIEPAALDALHSLRVHGVDVLAITGRPAGWSEPFALAWPAVPGHFGKPWFLPLAVLFYEMRDRWDQR